MAYGQKKCERRMLLRLACVAIASASLHQAFVSVGGGASVYPDSYVHSLTAVPAVAADAMSATGFEHIQNSVLWQPVIGSVVWAGTLLAILLKVKESYSLQKEWKGKAEEVRLAKTAALAGKPLNADVEAGLKKSLVHLLEREEAERQFLCFELPASPTPSSKAMAASRSRYTMNSSSSIFADERTETFVCIGAVALLTVFLLSISA